MSELRDSATEDSAPTSGQEQGAISRVPRDQPSPARRRSGRPRDPSVDVRVTKAVIELYARYGWAGLTFDEVARKAKVGKAGLRLRWASKEDLLLDCMAGVQAPRHTHTHRDLRVDLTSLAHALLSFYSSTGGLAYLRLYVECRYVPGLEDRWRTQYATPMFLEARALVHDAVARGELPESASPTLVLDALVGAIINHVLSTPPELFEQMQANAPVYIDSLVDLVMTGAGASVRAKPVERTVELRRQRQA